MGTSSEPNIILRCGADGTRGSVTCAKYVDKTALTTKFQQAIGNGSPLSGVYTAYSAVQGAHGGVTVLASRNVTLVAGSPKVKLFFADLTVQGALAIDGFDVRVSSALKVDGVGSELSVADSSGTITSLMVNSGSAKFSNTKGLKIGSVSITSGGDGGTLEGVVLSGAVAVSGAGSKLTIIDSSLTFSSSGEMITIGAGAQLNVRGCTITYASAATSYNSALFAATGAKTAVSVADSTIAAAGGARVFTSRNTKGASATFDNVNMTSAMVRTVTLTGSKNVSDGWGDAFYAVCGDGACKTIIKDSTIKGFGVVAKAGTAKSNKGRGCNTCQGSYGGAIYSEVGPLFTLLCESCSPPCSAHNAGRLSGRWAELRPCYVRGRQGHRDRELQLRLRHQRRPRIPVPYLRRTRPTQTAAPGNSPSLPPSLCLASRRAFPFPFSAPADPPAPRSAFCATGAAASTDKFSIASNGNCKTAAVGSTKYGPHQCGQTWGRAGQGVPADGTYSGSCKGSSFSLKKQWDRSRGAKGQHINN